MRENRLGGLIAEPSVTVLFDRSDLRVGTQIVQVIVGELSGVTVDEAVLVSDIACAGCDGSLSGADVVSKRHVVLEGNNVTARDGVFSFGNSEEGGHWEKIAW